MLLELVTTDLVFSIVSWNIRCTRNLIGGIVQLPRLNLSIISLLLLVTIIIIIIIIISILDSINNVVIMMII